ncbi:MAG: protein jag [Ruminococcaceae bacterium]|nr:protein jag [Oscillospiraceae bacterium]
MSKTIEKAAKTVQDALSLALKELNLTEAEVEYEIIEEGSKGIFGIGAKDAVIKVSPKIDFEARAYDFLTDIFVGMGLRVDIDITFEEKRMNIVLSGDNMGIVIGKRGDTLDALEHLVSLCVNRGDGEYIRVSLDTENYREKRKATLINLAENLAHSVVKNKKKVTLEPMSSNERRIIHSTLQNNENVDTYSVGDEPNRKVVIALKRNK